MNLITCLDRSTGQLVQRPEDQLIKTELTQDNDDIVMDSVEYCLKGCEGEFHKTLKPQGEGFACERHVHRSAHGKLKRWPEGMDEVTIRGVKAAFDIRG